MNTKTEKHLIQLECGCTLDRIVGWEKISNKEGTVPIFFSRCSLHEVAEELLKIAKLSLDWIGVVRGGDTYSVRQRIESAIAKAEGK